KAPRKEEMASHKEKVNSIPLREDQEFVKLKGVTAVGEKKIEEMFYVQHMIFNATFNVTFMCNITSCSEVGKLRLLGLRVENADVKTKYDDAINEITKLKAELKSRIEELEKGRTDTVAENARHDDTISELKAEEVVNIPSSVVDQLNNVSEVSSKSKIQFSYTNNGDIISLYKNACDAEIDAIKANREETLRWCFYTREFKSMYKDFMVNNKVGEKKAKGRFFTACITSIPELEKALESEVSEFSSREQELLDRIASLEASINKSVHAVVLQNSMSSSQNSIRAVYQTPALENDGAVFNMFQVYRIHRDPLEGFQQLDIPESLPTLQSERRSESRYVRIPTFSCGCSDTKNEKFRTALDKLMVELKTRLPSTSHTKQQKRYIPTRMRNYIAPVRERYNSYYTIPSSLGKNGQGKTDYGMESCATGRIIGVVEVKREDFLQGIVQASVQMESSLASTQ
ncbi:7116_t:CDS:10, partial [Ambispora leptoticha]